MHHFPKFAFVSFVALVAACNGEDTTKTGSVADSAVDSTVGVSFVNSASHDDPVDSVDDDSWITPSSEDDDSALVRILLTDAPIDAENVFVTICGIDVENKNLASKENATGTAWQRVSSKCQEVDLLSLQNGVTEAMGIGELSPGDYGKIRLMVKEGSMVKNQVAEHLALSAEGEETGFTINSEFSIGKGDAATVTVDFDAAESIHESEGGGFDLRPALSVVGIQTRARIRTNVTDSANLNHGESQGDGAGGAAGLGDGTCQAGATAIGDGAGGVSSLGDGTSQAGATALGDGAGGAVMGTSDSAT